MSSQHFAKVRNMNREEKLAAAKRKLKQFKQKRGKELKSKGQETEDFAAPQNKGKKEISEKSNFSGGIPTELNDVTTDNEQESILSTNQENNDSKLQNGFSGNKTEEVSDDLTNNIYDHIVENGAENFPHGDESIFETRLLDDGIPLGSDELLLTEKVDAPPENYESGTTTETLLQISTKLNGIAAEVNNVMQIDCESFGTTSTHYVLSELETRNQQLAEQLASVNRQKQELVIQVEKLTQQMKELQIRVEADKNHLQNQSMQEQAMLKQQIQVQMQTIGILVAEKQEMQHQVHEARTNASHDEHARQRYQDELQDARVKIQSLERELSSQTEVAEVLKNAKSELEVEQKNLQLELTKIKKSNTDSSMHVTELTQKLSAKEKECSQLSSEVGDLHEKLAMAEVLLQQLSSSSDETPEDQVSKLQDERENLNQKLIEVKVALDLYQQAFEQLTAEREQLSRQYEDVNKEMQHQVSELSQQVQDLKIEKSDLLTERQELNSKVKQLEENRSHEDHDQQDHTKVSEELQDQICKLRSDMDQTSQERDELARKFNAQLRNNERLARLNEEQELQLTQLGETVSNSTVSAEEHSRLLEQAQNDKSTISRALLQNKQLKQQLEEMHDGFIKLSNDKMQLATELSTQSHSYHESMEEIERYKILLSEMKLEIETKNRNINQIQNALLQQDSSNYPSQSKPDDNHTINHTINEEVKALEDTVNILSEQNGQLKEMVTRLQSEVDSKESSKSSITVEDNNDLKPVSGNEDMVVQMNISIQELKKENAALLHKVEEKQQENTRLSISLHSSQSLMSESVVSHEEHNSLVQNMSLLQERFTKVMTEKVDALNKIEELEHINLQLQNECDTIGEYITLYHNQRQLLKQRHHEKDEYVSSIAQEREMMQHKLEKLQSLVLTLVNSRQEADTSSPENLQQNSLAVSEHISDSLISDLSEITPHDWPDMLGEDENKHRLKTRPDLLPANASLPSEEHSDGNKLATASENYPGKSLRLGEDSPLEQKNTATEIISLLEQMQRPSQISYSDRPQGFCLRYMGQYTAI